MTDMMQALKEYGHEVDVIVAPIVPEELEHRAPRREAMPVRRQMPGWFAAVAVAAGVLVVLGGVSLLAGGADPDVAPASPSTHTVSVEVSGVADRWGDDLAGVVYAGGELSDLDRDAVGGFWSVITSNDFATSEVVRKPDGVGAVTHRFPHVSTEALAVEPGTYTLVLWVDTMLGGYDRWVPLNTDGMGLFGCQYVFEVGDDGDATVELSPTFYPNGWNTDCVTGAVLPGTDADAAVNPVLDDDLDAWGEPRAALMPSVTGLTDGAVVRVDLTNVTGRDGHDLAGVLYEGGELLDLDREAKGGFWSVIRADNYSTGAFVREPGNVDDPADRFPYVSREALVVEPGAYTLVLWVDRSLGGVERWVPINTDGVGLLGCQYVFEVGDDGGANIELSPTFYPNGWNTDCITGTVVPGTDAEAAVNPTLDDGAP
ncbi:MAG: hypothetical protein ACR2NG_07460 [Acidimicrobiia bacterium]